MYSIIPSLCGFWSSLLWLETDKIFSFASQYKIWYLLLKKERIHPDAASAGTLLVRLFDTMQLLYKRTRTDALVDLHHKNTWLKKKKKKKGKFVCWMCADKQVWAEKDRPTLTKHENTSSTSWICMPVGPQSRGDNKSHFRHVCQVSRRHLSVGRMWWVGSE